MSRLLGERKLTGCAETVQEIGLPGYFACLEVGVSEFAYVYLSGSQLGVSMVEEGNVRYLGSCKIRYGRIHRWRS